MPLTEGSQGCLGGLATQDSGPGATQEIPPPSTPTPEATPPPPNVLSAPTGITQGAANPDGSTNASPYVYTPPANSGLIAAAAPGTQTTDEIHPGGDRSVLMVQVIPASMANPSNPDGSLLTLDTFHEPPNPLVTIQRGYTVSGPWQDIEKVNTDGGGRIRISNYQMTYLCQVEIAGSSPPPAATGTNSLTAAQGSALVHGERLLQFSAFYGEGGLYYQSPAFAVNCPSANFDPSWDQKKAIPVNLNLRPLATSGVQREGVQR